MKKQYYLAILCMLCFPPAWGEDVTPSPWVTIPADAKVYVHTMLDIPLRNLIENPEGYIGTVFEDQFKFYHIYHGKDDADPASRQQVILGKTHFTARPVQQDTMMIQIQITPQQESWMHEQHIERQDVVRARVRFVGIAPGDALAFELLEITRAPIHMRKQ